MKDQYVTVTFLTYHSFLFLSSLLIMKVIIIAVIWQCTYSLPTNPCYLKSLTLKIQSVR